MQGDVLTQRQKARLQHLTMQLEIVVEIATQLSLFQGKWQQLDGYSHLQVPNWHPCSSATCNP